MRSLSTVLFSALVTMMLVKPAGAVLINFDDVADNTNINTQYSASGVTFGCFNGSPNNLCTGNVLAQSSVGAASASNVIGFDSGTLSDILIDERTGYFKASFSSPASFVSIDAQAVLPPEFLGTPTNAPFIQAFSSTNAFLGQAVYPIAYGGTNYGTYQTLSISRPTADIAYVAFSSFHNPANSIAVYGQFDNLNFTLGTPPPPPPPPATPEPSALLLLGLGVGAVALGRRFFGDSLWRQP